MGSKNSTSKKRIKKEWILPDGYCIDPRGDKHLETTIDTMDITHPMDQYRARVDLVTLDEQVFKQVDQYEHINTVRIRTTNISGIQDWLNFKSWGQLVLYLNRKFKPLTRKDLNILCKMLSKVTDFVHISYVNMYSHQLSKILVACSHVSKIYFTKCRLKRFRSFSMPKDVKFNLTYFYLSFSLFEQKQLEIFWNGLKNNDSLKSQKLNILLWISYFREPDKEAENIIKNQCWLNANVDYFSDSEPRDQDFQNTSDEDENI